MPITFNMFSTIFTLWLVLLGISISQASETPESLGERQKTFFQELNSMEVGLGIGLLDDREDLTTGPSLHFRLDLKNQHESYSLQYMAFTSEGFVEQAAEWGVVCLLSVTLFCDFIDDDFVYFSDISLMYGRRLTGQDGVSTFSAGIGWFEADDAEEDEQIFDTTGLVLNFTYEPQKGNLSPKYDTYNYYCHANLNDESSYISCGITVALGVNF